MTDSSNYSSNIALNGIKSQQVAQARDKLIGNIEKPNPAGPPGNWNLVWSDEFTGTSLDTTKWYVFDDGNVKNSVPCYASNVWVSGGNLVLRILNANSGACLTNADVRSNPMPSNGYKMPVGYACEARINFPGIGNTINNWPAWWTVGEVEPAWPACGEIDIAEGLGYLAAHYIGSTGTFGSGNIPGTYSNAFHTYTMWRDTNMVHYYYDGTEIFSHAPSDTGVEHGLVLNNGKGYGPAVYPSQVMVDYVRIWAPER